MAQRTILIWPNPALSQRAKPVGPNDTSLPTLVRDLFDTMYANDGIGLAATQVGDMRRVLVLDLDASGQAKRDPEVRAELASWGWAGPIALINPEIVAASGDIVWEEGCLSVPGVLDGVRRKAHIEVRAQDARGAPLHFHADGLYAVAVQHELDHLNGRVFVEYLSKLKRDVIRRKMQHLMPEPESAQGRPRRAGSGR